jgi:hypothetical protein
MQVLEGVCVCVCVCVYVCGFQETLKLASLVADELAPPSISLPLALYVLDPVHGRACNMSGVVHALQTQLSYWHCSRPEPGTYFTCFMSTKVQILTAQEVRASSVTFFTSTKLQILTAEELRAQKLLSQYKCTCFTSTNVQILTLMRLPGDTPSCSGLGGCHRRCWWRNLPPPEFHLRCSPGAAYADAC